MSIETRLEYNDDKKREMRGLIGFWGMCPRKEVNHQNPTLFFFL
jgi:hypothetical protein